MPIMNGFKACKTIVGLYDKYQDLKKGKSVPLLKRLNKKPKRKQFFEDSKRRPKRSRS